MSKSLNILAKVPSKYADVVSQLFSFLCVGGLAAILNVLCFTGIYNALALSAGTVTAYFVGFFLATEISILANFALNDHITFRHLRDSECQRPWSIRCLRFHVTCIVSTGLVMGISFSLLHFAHFAALFAQATALVIATAFNFMAHHAFTYRRPNRRLTVTVIL